MISIYNCYIIFIILSILTFIIMNFKIFINFCLDKLILSKYIGKDNQMYINLKDMNEKLTDKIKFYQYTYIIDNYNISDSSNSSYKEGIDDMENITYIVDIEKSKNTEDKIVKYNSSNNQLNDSENNQYLYDSGVNIIKLSDPVINQSDGCDFLIYYQDKNNSEVNNLKINYPEINNPEVSNPEVNNPEVNNLEVNNQEVSNPEVNNPEVNNLEVNYPVINNLEVNNPEINNLEVNNLEINNPEVNNPEIIDPEVNEIESILINLDDDQVKLLLSDNETTNQLTYDDFIIV